MLKSVQVDPNQVDSSYDLALLQSDLGDKKSVRHGAIYGCRQRLKVDSRLRREAGDREFVDRFATPPEGRHGHVPTVPTRWARASYRSTVNKVTGDRQIAISNLRCDLAYSR